MSILKYIIFFPALFIGVPVGIFLAVNNEKFRKLMVCGTIFFTISLQYATINFFSHEHYRGTARGVEISLVNMASFVLLGMMIILYRSKFKFFPAGSWSYVLYFLSCAISVINAESFLFSFMELWKMFMIYLLFVSIYNYLMLTHDFELVIRTFGVVAILSFFVVLKQKYVDSEYQPSGLFPHQNSMAMYMGMISPIFFSKLLNCRMKLKEDIFYFVCFALSSGGLILTYSRGALFFFPFACMAVAFMSFVYDKSMRLRQIKIFSVMFVIGVIGLALVLPRVISRFQNAPESSSSTRIKLAGAAVNMANDKFLGVGVNNWGIKINPPYTYATYREADKIPEDAKDGLVETIYLMVAAECGWLGLGILLLWLGYYYWRNFINMFKYKKTKLFYLAVGIFGGLSMNYGQSILEWVLKQQSSFAQIMIIFAIIAAMVVLQKERSIFEK